jgi:predicted DNA-binding transcriptional regulator AlpA
MMMKNSNQVIKTELERRRLNIAALEKLLGCSRQTIWRWYTTGDFPRPHYLGQNRLWFIDEVEDWLEEQMLSRTSQKKVSRGACNQQRAEASSAESFYTTSGSSPPDVTSSEEGGPAA